MFKRGADRAPLVRAATKACSRFLLAAALAAFALPTPSAHAQRGALAEWEIHDSLGREWRDELLHYDLKLARPIAATTELSAVDGTGAEVPIQVVSRETKPNGLVTSVRVALQTSLEPFGQRTFRLLAAPPAAPPGDLAVATEAGAYRVTTSKIGVAVAAGGEQFPSGRPFRDLPAPIRQVRGDGSGWVGEGFLTGSRLVYGWKGELLASGPVFAHARVTYDFGNGESYVVDVRLPAGQPVVLVREDRNLPRDTGYYIDPALADAFQLALAQGLAPTHVYSKRGLGVQGYFVEEGPAFGYHFLTPAQLHWDDRAANIVGTWKEGSPNATFMGLFPRFLSHWSRPHDTFIPLAWVPERGLVARFFLNDGSREWALMSGKRDEMIVPRGTGGETIGGYFDALLLNNKWGETPLDKVKDWVLDWGKVRYQPGRHYERATIERGNMPYFAEQFLSGGQKWHDTYIHVHQTWTGEGDAWARWKATLETTPESQLLSLRASGAFVEYKQTDPDYWPRGNWIGPSNANMIYMGNGATILGALALENHPEQKAWAAPAVDFVRDALKSASCDGTGWIESPGYDGGGTVPFMRSALQLRDAGLADLLSDGYLEGVAMYHANMVTPPDPRVKNLRHLPEFGDVFDLAADPEATRARPTYWKELVPTLAETSRKHARQILWAIGESVPGVNPRPIDGDSFASDCFGTFFRHGLETPDESYLAIHQSSRSYGHFHFDLGALYYFGKGAPLAVDWPSLYSPQIKDARMHNAVVTPSVARYNYSGRVNATAFFPRVDYTRSRAYYDNDFPMVAEAFDDGVPPTSLPEHVWQRQVLFLKSPDPAGATYLVVRDGVSDTGATEWNLWTLSRKLRLERGRAEVTGLYGVDMTVAFFAGPDAVPSTEMFGFGALPPATPAGGDAVWSDVAPGVREVVVPQKFLMQQNVVRLASAAGGDYGAVLFPHRVGEPAPEVTRQSDGSVRVSFAAGDDTVYLFPTAKSIEAGAFRFDGRSAVVSRAGATRAIHLLDGTILEVDGGLAIRGAGPVSVEQKGGQLEIWTDGDAREVVVGLPQGIAGKLVSGDAGAIKRATRGEVTLRLSARRQHFVFE